MTNLENAGRRSDGRSPKNRRDYSYPGNQNLTERQLLDIKKEEAFQQIKLAFTVGFRF